MRIFLKVLKLLAWLLLLLCLSIGGLLLYLTYTDYQPKPVEEVKVNGNALISPGSHKVFSLLLWNIGYCGLGKEADFFYDGGKNVNPDFDHFQNNLNGIYNRLIHSDTIDFILLQEVDKESGRSFFTNQVQIISKGIRDFDYGFTKNYFVRFIPFPIFEPMGEVTAGLMTLSRFKPIEAFRYASPENFTWPKRIFFLDRCFLLERFRLNNRKELVVINLHNSAWDEGASLRVQEIDLLCKTVQDEYKKGNYVIVGGDWNQNPPGIKAGLFRSGEKVCLKGTPLKTELLPKDWSWVFDPFYPTNRDVDQPYSKGKTLVSIIDFFVLSPNIIAEEVRTIPTGFANSDHQPVYLRIRLRE